MGSRTGYALTDKIGNEDLFPDEGYAFPPQLHTKQTKSYRSSTLFPFNPEINRMARERSLATRCESSDDSPPVPLVDPPVRFGRTNRRKAILSSTLDMRAKQISYKEQLSEYALRQSDPVLAQQAEALELVKSRVAEEALARRRGVRALSDAYEEQLQSVAARREQELAEQRQFEARLKEEDTRVAAEEAAKRERQRILRKEMREEYDRKNQDLVQARQKRIDAEKAEEQRLQSESAEIERRRDERAAEDERRRLEKTKMRARVCEDQARSLSQLQSKQELSQQAAESGMALTEQQRLEKERKKHEELERERHAEWLRLQKERAARRVYAPQQPFPRRVEEANSEAAAEEEKRKERKSYSEYQRLQAEERRKAEQKQADEARERDARMIADNEKRFEESLGRLQALVPSELQITVPKYQPRTSFSSIA